ncbi:MAG TPA: hypothetical protein EYN66_13140, partial [Myxococcales bacterium]|nr:hypothetical protein [Myxococcales bacterium]
MTQSAVLFVDAQPGLTLELSSPESVVSPGSGHEVRLNYKNTGGAHAYNKIIRVQASEGITLENTTIDTTVTALAGEDEAFQVNELIVGAALELRFRARFDRVFEAGQHCPTVRVRVEDPDGTLLTEEELTFDLQAAPELEVSFDSITAGGKPGERIKARLKISNAGNAPANDVLVHASIPESCRIVSMSGDDNTDVDNQAGSWALSCLEPDCSTVLGIALEVGDDYASGVHSIETLFSVVDASMQEHEISRTWATQITAEAELAVTGRIEPEQVNAGEVTRLYLNCSNQGDANSGELFLIVSVPAHCRISQLSNGGVIDRETGKLCWTLVNVAAQSEAPEKWVEITVDSPLERGEHTFAFEVMLQSTHGRAECKGNVPLNVLAMPRGEVAIRARQPNGVPGQELVYTLQYSNQGGATAETMRVVMALPERCRFLSATGQGSCDPDNSEVAWSLDNVTAGSEGELTLKVILDSEFPPGITEITCVAGVSDDCGIHRASNEVSTFVEATPLLTAAVSAKSDCAKPGETIVVRARAGVEGHAAANKLKFQMVYPKGLSPIDEVENASWNKRKRTLTWQLDSASPGYMQEFLIPSKFEDVLPAGTHLFEIPFQISSAGAEAVDGSSDPIRVEAAPELALSINALKPDGAPGKSAEFSVTLDNSGNADATRPTVAIEVPDGAEALWGPGGAADIMDRTTGTIYWRLDTLPAGESAQTSVTLGLPATIDEGTLELIVKALAGCDDNDRQHESTATITIDTTPHLNLQIETVISDVAAMAGSDCNDGAIHAAPAQVVTYTIHLTNSGIDLETPTVLRLELPAKMSGLSASDNGQLDADENSWIWELGSLEHGIERSLSASARLDDEFVDGVTSLTARAITEGSFETEIEHNITVAVAPELQLEVRASETDLQAGESLTLTAHYEIGGNADAANLELSMLILFVLLVSLTIPSLQKQMLARAATKDARPAYIWTAAYSTLLSFIVGLIIIYIFGTFAPDPATLVTLPATRLWIYSFIALFSIIPLFILYFVSLIVPGLNQRLHDRETLSALLGGLGLGSFLSLVMFYILKFSPADLIHPLITVAIFAYLLSTWIGYYLSL